MNREELLDKMADFLKQALMSRASEEIAPDDNLAEDLGLDSMGAIEFVGLVEDEYGISVSPDEIATIRTLNDAVDLAARKIDAK